jgi:hypothetical protein
MSVLLPEPLGRATMTSNGMRFSGAADKTYDASDAAIITSWTPSPRLRARTGRRKVSTHVRSGCQETYAPTR